MAMQCQSLEMRLDPPRNSRQDIVLPDRIWYNNSIDLTRSRFYILALRGADELFASGRLQVLYHGQSAKYYKQVLGGRVSGHLPRLAIADANQGLEADGVDGVQNIRKSRKRVVRRGVISDDAEEGEKEQENAEPSGVPT